jgi:hypothetical protein
MSLDVRLRTKVTINKRDSGIFYYEIYSGEVREMPEYEWKERFPWHTPTILDSVESSKTVYEANITHNLGKMGAEAGIYKALWRPEELPITTAGELIPLLRDGITLMDGSPSHFKSFDAENGWGTYTQFLPWVKRYLSACIEYPEAEISASR